LADTVYSAHFTHQERSGASDFDFSERYAKQDRANTDGCRDAPDLAYEKDCIDHDAHPLNNLTTP
jgi:hypothetical protein